MKKHIGSTIALVLGILFFVAGLTQPTSNVDFFRSGIFVTFGALAYRSAKKRILGEVTTSLLRKVLELVAIAIIVALFLLPHNLLNIMSYRPVEYIVIPLWAIVPYIIIVLKRKIGEGDIIESPKSERSKPRKLSTPEGDKWSTPWRFSSTDGDMAKSPKSSNEDSSQDDDILV